MIKLLICDDQEIVCEGLRTILDADAEIEVVGVAHDGLEALNMVERVNPNFVLMDLKMPVMNGVIATRKIREKHPGIFILVLTMFEQDEWVFDAIRSGASGYMLKDTPKEDLIKAIKGTAAGKIYVDPDVAGVLFSNIRETIPTEKRPSTHLFTERESDVLQLLAQGLSNTEIAHQLYLSEGTVRNYMSTIFTKLGVSNRAQAAVLALRYGLVDTNDT